MNTVALLDLLCQVERVIDEHPDLTRKRTTGFLETARLELDGMCGIPTWTVRVKVRNLRTKGRGARGFYDAQGNGDDPEAAVASFLERLPFFVQTTS